MGPIESARMPVADGFLWTGQTLLDRPGQHVFVFSVTDITTTLTMCASAVIVVADAEAGDPGSIDTGGEYTDGAGQPSRRRPCSSLARHG
jgi:hypothetical protein